MARGGVAILFWRGDLPGEWEFWIYGAAGGWHETGAPAYQPMEWYYSQNSTQLGPVSDGELRARISSGQIAPTELVWREGMRDWVSVASVPELSGLVRSAVVATVTPQMPAAVPEAVSPYAPPAGQMQYVPAPPTSGLAIASLICGLVGLVTCMFVPGIPAVICGHLALNRMADPSVNMQGRGMAIAGLIMGYIGVLVCAVFLLMFLLAFAGVLTSI